jgi:hypothetical protein
VAASRIRAHILFTADARGSFREIGPSWAAATVSGLGISILSGDRGQSELTGHRERSQAIS